METKKTKPEMIKINATWKITDKEQQLFNIKYHPDPLDPNTDLQKHLILLANIFNTGVSQIASLLRMMPVPTGEEIATTTYDFEKHGKEYGEGLFALYNFKKTILEEIIGIVQDTLPKAFLDIIFVKSAQEKIFQTLREQHVEQESKEPPVSESVGEEHAS